MLLNSHKKKISKKIYMLNRYSQPIEFQCVHCYKKIKAKKVVECKEQDSLICMKCYTFLLREDKEKRHKKKIDNIVQNNNCSRSDIYRRLPLLQTNVLKDDSCFICHNQFVDGNVKALLTDGNDIITRIVPTKYCKCCEVGFVTADISRQISDINSGFYINTFKISLGKSKVYTVDALWGMINSGDISKAQNPKNIITKPKVIVQEVEVPINSRIYVGVDGIHDCITPSSEKIIEFKGVLYDSDNKRVVFKLKKCERCGKIFISDRKYRDWKNRLKRYLFEEKQKEKNNRSLIKKHDIASAYEQIPNKIHEISPRSFLTRTNVFHCSNNDHKLVDVRCKVKLLSKTGTIFEQEIPAGYCIKCDKYYILESDYKKIKLQGRIVCKVVEQSFWTSVTNKNGYSLNEESLLHIMGYNVNAQENLLKSQRWRILEIIVDERILTRMEICSHLDYLIARSRRRSNFLAARSKWLEDRNHIINYQSDKVDTVTANSIIHRSYKKS